MCTRDAVRVLTLGTSSFFDSGPNTLQQAGGVLNPTIPMPAMPTPLKPADPANKVAEDLWSPKGVKDSQALAARMGTNALVVPFQSLNRP